MERIRQTILFISFVGLTTTCPAQKHTPVITSRKVGDITIKIPQPHRTLSVVAGKDHDSMKNFVPSVNRLVAGYLRPADLKRLRTSDESMTLSHYAMVQIPRRVEKLEISRAQFKQIAALTKKQFSNTMSRSAKSAEDELNERLKQLDVDEKISLGRPVPIGVFFDKTDAYGFGLVMAVGVAGDTDRVAMGSAMIRVKNKLTVYYLYRLYENADTIKTLSKELEAWSDAVQKANR